MWLVPIKFIPALHKGLGPTIAMPKKRLMRSKVDETSRLDGVQVADHAQTTARSVNLKKMVERSPVSSAISDGRHPV